MLGIFFFISAFGSRRLMPEDRFAIGNGDLVIVRMDFAESEEAMAIAAIFHKSRLQRRFDARYFGEIDIASELFSGFSLEVKLINAIAADDHDPSFLGVRCVDQHFSSHG